jgi:hypothetical protein
MKNQILDLLQYSSLEYDMLLFDLYFTWCNGIARSTKHHQFLLVNRNLSRWFMKEYYKNEVKFLNYSQSTHPYNTEELRILYDETTTQINFYPKALLNEIKKQAKKAVRITDKQFQSNLN